MATRKYKTLAGLLSQTLYGILNFNDFKSGRFYHKKHGYVSFSLSEEETEKVYSEMSSVVYANGKKNAFRLRNYRGQSYRIFNGLCINKKKAYYCAGQDYPSEIRTIQSILRN